MHELQIANSEFVADVLAPVSRNIIWVDRTALVVLIVIACLAGAVVAPCFIGAQNAARRAQIKSSMHDMQLALESYATDTKSGYVDRIERLSPQLSGGAFEPKELKGNFPKLYLIRNLKIDNVEKLRNTEPENAIAIKQQISMIPEGMPWVGYSGIKDSTGKFSSYAVVGGMGPHLVSGNAGRTLVLSNQ